MGTISIEKMDHLFWLGRYTERVYTTLRVFEKYYDVMIDGDDFAYDEYCRSLTIPNIYTGKEDFADSYIFEEKNPDSLYANLIRAFDNAVVIRESLSSTVLAYIQMALDVLKSARGSRAPLMELQRVMDYLLAFWGSADDFVVDEYTRNILKCGKYVERLDLYLRFGFSAKELDKELTKLVHRMKTIDAGNHAAAIDRLRDMIDTDEKVQKNRLQVIQILEGSVME